MTCQEIPEVLIGHLPSLVTLIDKYIKFNNKLLQMDDDAEAGLQEYVKATIFNLLTFWVDKHEEDLKPYVGQLVENTWTLLTTTGSETKYDLMASRALNFLSKVTRSREHAASFDNEDVLESVLQKAVIPNISLRESDVELFEDEPIEYIRRDLEGTDSETRRRAATDFLRQLMQQFQERVTKLTLNYITSFLSQYTADPANNWKFKDTAVYLYCSIAAVGAVTSLVGVKTVNPYVDVLDFFQHNIAQDLVVDTAHPIIQVDAIK